MKRILSIWLVLLLMISLGTSSAFADTETGTEVSQGNEPSFSYAFTLTDASGNPVTSVNTGDTVKASVSLTRTDIPDGTNYDLLMFEFMYEYPAGTGIAASVPKTPDYAGFTGSQRTGTVNNSFVKAVYMHKDLMDSSNDYSKCTISVPKTFLVMSFDIRVNSEAIKSYTFTPKAASVYLNENNKSVKYVPSGNSATLSISDAQNESVWDGGSGGSTTGENAPSSSVISTPEPAVISIDQSYSGSFLSGYDNDYDGTAESVMPANSITRAEVSAIFYRLLPENVRSAYTSSTNNFSDVPAEEWYNETVSTLAKCGVLKGSDNNNDGKPEFRPNDKITRAEFTTIVYNVTSASGSEEVKFSDTFGHWAAGYIKTVAANGWIKGSDVNDDGVPEFRPEDTITRAEAAAIINRILARTELTGNETVNFADNQNQEEWFYKDIILAANKREVKEDPIS